MKVFLIVTLLTVSVTSTKAHAQLWGAGVYPGAQGCPAPYARERLPEGIQDIDDDIDLLQQDLREAKEDLREMKRRQRDVNRDYDGAVGEIRGVLKNGDVQNSQRHNVAQAVIDHIQMNRPGDQALYDPANVCNVQGGDLPWPTFCEQVEGSGVNQPALQYPRWIRAGESGRVDPAICSGNSSAVRDDMMNREYQQRKCSEAVGNLPELHSRKVGLDQQIAERERLVSNLEDQIKDLRQERKDEMREYRRAQRRGEDTEGGYCYSCNHPNDRPVGTFEKVASVALGGLGAYLGYRGTQRAINRTIEMNGNLGWPTDPRYTAGMALGAAMPGVMFGIYGAMNGLGTGGCNGFPFGGMGGVGGLMGPAGYPMMGGAFGYPPGWGGMPGGGVFMPGMGGIGGMYPGYGAPGAIIGGIVGAFVGMPYAGMPYGGMPYMGTFAGGPIAGAFAGGFAGMPMAGGPFAGMPMAGGPFAGMPAGGFPAAGFPAAGLPAGGFPAAGFPMVGMPMAGGPYAGMPMAGMPMAGGPYAGMPMAGLPMMGGPMAGMPMAGAPFAGAPNAGLQYQQFIMQQQQQMLQMQMRAQQDYMNRQQIIGRLSSQMMQIQMQIQQISSGVYGGGYYSGGIGGGVGGGPGSGVSILPYPGPGQVGYPGQGLPGTGPSPYDPNIGRPIPARGP